MIICYEASEDVREERMMKRDGYKMTPAQMNHKSEQEITLIKDMASVIIDTDNMTIAEQTAETIKIVQSLTDVYA
jgi:dephospho-CoA kinase